MALAMSGVPLVGDRLHSFATGDGRGEYIDNVIGRFLMVIDHDCVEQVLVASTDILSSHKEFQRNSEH